MSVGIVDGEVLLDLNYGEDSAAEVDFNVVMTQSGRIVEVQGTAEGRPFSREEMEQLLNLAEKGIFELMDIQKALLMEDLSKKFGDNKWHSGWFWQVTINTRSGNQGAHSPPGLSGPGPGEVGICPVEEDGKRFTPMPGKSGGNRQKARGMGIGR